MAYKFQVGVSQLSGNLTQEGNVIGEGLGRFNGGLNINSNMTVSTAGAIAGATSISGSGEISGLELDIEKEAAVDVALFAIQEANASPDGMKALFSGPETISLSAINNSPSANVLMVLSSTPEDIYEI